MSKLNKTERRVLETVREKVESTHWMQGEYEDVAIQKDGTWKPTGCLVGLVTKQFGFAASEYGYCDFTDPGVPKGIRAVLGSLLKQINKNRVLNHHTNIEDWNDMTSRKRGDILKVIDGALAEEV